MWSSQVFSEHTSCPVHSRGFPVPSYVDSFQTFYFLKIVTLHLSLLWLSARVLFLVIVILRQSTLAYSSDSLYL